MKAYHRLSRAQGLICVAKELPSDRDGIYERERGAATVDSVDHERPVACRIARLCGLVDDGGAIAFHFIHRRSQLAVYFERRWKLRSDSQSAWSSIFGITGDPELTVQHPRSIHTCGLRYADYFVAVVR